MGLGKSHFPSHPNPNPNPIYPIPFAIIPSHLSHPIHPVTYTSRGLHEIQSFPEKFGNLVTRGLQKRKLCADHLILAGKILRWPELYMGFGMGWDGILNGWQVYPS